MQKGLRIGHKALLLVIVPLVFEIGFVVALVFMLDKAQDQVKRDRSFVLSLNTVLGRIASASRCLADYGTTSDRQYLDQYVETMKPVPLALSTLRKLVLANKNAPESDRQESLATIDGLQGSLDVMDEFIAREGKEDSVSMFGRLRQLRSVMKKLGPAAEKFGSGFANVRENAQDIERTRQQVKWLIVVGVIGNVVLAVCLAGYFSRGTVTRLDKLMDNTRKLVAGENLDPAVGGADEIAELDVVFIDMAKKLDAAARKERAIVDNAADVIGALDKELKIQAVNPACIDALGYTQKDLVGRCIEDLLLSEDRKTFADSTSKTVEGDREKAATVETRFRRGDGNIIHLLWSLQWSADHDSYFFVAHDISTRKELERLKQEFISMVSHDLRSPLTAIQIFLNLLADGSYGELPEKVAKKAAVADRSANRLISLINDLLDLERMETGQIPLDMQSISMRSVMLSSVEAISGLAEAKRIKVDVVGDCEVLADHDRLVQVSVNILGNAVKFSPEESTITISFEAGEKFCEARITDQGRGIPEKVRATIFERFKQVEAADATVKKGSGLGLSIAKAIVEQHGGEIGVESIEGQGSTFWYRVPLAATAVEVEAATPSVLQA